MNDSLFDSLNNNKNNICKLNLDKEIEINKILCIHCKRTKINRVACIGKCVADSEY